MNEYSETDVLVGLDFRYIILIIIMVTVFAFTIWYLAYKEGQESMRFNPPP